MQDSLPYADRREYPPSFLLVISVEQSLLQEDFQHLNATAIIPECFKSTYLLAKKIAHISWIFSLYRCLFMKVVWVVTFFVMLFLFYLQTKVLFTEAYRQNSRLDHLTQIMGFHPQYLACFLRTQNRLMRAEGPLPYEYRHYIAIIVSKSKRYIVLCSSTAVIPTLFHSLISWCELSLT